jgi:bifunctional DNase/RNase
MSSVLMELNKIIISEMQDTQIIWLKEVHGERHFPIMIGSEVALAIDRRLKGTSMPRPMTHDLLANTIEQLGGTLERIAITHLQDTTFFAKLVIRQGGQLIEVDSRPSDAIALGIANTVPIYVADAVLAEVCG